MKKILKSERMIGMKINWKIRAKNKMFWTALIPAVLLLVQVVAAAVGISFAWEGLSDKLLDVVNAVFSLMAILGIVADPTTRGFSDSERALSYREPGGDEK